MIEFNQVKNFSDKVNSIALYERLYAVLTEEGNIINYGVFHSKITKNKFINTVKALGLYKTTGARETRKTFIHPKLKMIIDSVIDDAELNAKTIVDMVNGKYIDIEKFGILDLTKFNLLPDNDFFVSNINFGTYILINKDNGLYKIGRTKRLSERLINLRKSISVNIDAVCFLPIDIEAKLHEEYKLKREFGEWFSLSFDDVLDIKNKYNFDFLK